MAKSDIPVVQEKFDAVYLRHGAGNLGCDSLDSLSPDEAVARMEEEDMERAVRARIEKEDEDFIQRLKDRVRVETLERFFSHVLVNFQRTGDVLEVGKNVVAVAKYQGHVALDGWSLEDIGKACGDKGKRATVSARVKRLCNDPIERAGGVAQAAFQQSPEQCAKSAAAQMGNTNRKKVD